ncbi:unnamed protein product, partial [Ectocarpus sp. 4 AP-2014]
GFGLPPGRPPVMAPRGDPRPPLVRHGFQGRGPQARGPPGTGAFGGIGVGGGVGGVVSGVGHIGRLGVAPPQGRGPSPRGPPGNGAFGGLGGGVRGRGVGNIGGPGASQPWVSVGGSNEEDGEGFPLVHTSPEWTPA